MKISLAFLISVSLLGSIACRSSVKKYNVRSSSSTEESPHSSNSERAGGSSGGMTEPSPAGLNLVWKRYRAVEGGLMQGLALPKADVCKELGQHSCIDKIHLTVLGGNEPFVMGQYERPQSPTALTPLAMERVVLAACGKRLELDKVAGASAVVFKHFPLAGGAPNAAQLQAQAGELYRRLLARDPEKVELDTVAGFAGKIGTADKAALALCLAIGSSAENVFL
jgi:hypothetical protein